MFSHVNLDYMSSEHYPCVGRVPYCIFSILPKQPIECCQPKTVLGPPVCRRYSTITHDGMVQQPPGRYKIGTVHNVPSRFLYSSDFVLSQRCSGGRAFSSSSATHPYCNSECCHTPISLSLACTPAVPPRRHAIGLFRTEL